MPVAGDHTNRNIIMLKGAKTANNKGHTQDSKTKLKRAGSISHQMNMAIRGPKNKRDVIIQHIVYLNRLFKVSLLYYIFTVLDIIL
jgi:hypothetical protein